MSEQIGDIMTPNPSKLPSSATVLDAARVMRNENIGDVMIVDGEKLVGIVTDRDLVIRGIAAGNEAERTKLGDICSGDVATLTPDASVDDAIRLMQDKAIRRVPVVEDGKPVGIVSIGDLAVERDRDSALGGISAAPPNN